MVREKGSLIFYQKRKRSLQAGPATVVELRTGAGKVGVEAKPIWVIAPVRRIESTKNIVQVVWLD